MKVNISIDDVSPHPKSSVNVIKTCQRLIEDFNDIKFTLFVPIAYWRTIRPGTATSRPLYLNEHPDFCETIKSLSPRNYEVCYHGLHHGIPGKSDNDEFQNLSHEAAMSKFGEMKRIVQASGLEETFKPVFRPPAWRMSPGAILAAKDFGFKVLALSPKEYARQTYGSEDEKFGKVVYYTCNPPFDPLEKHEKNEIVYHACEWDKNYLSEDAAEILKTWLKDQDDVEFEFMENM